MRSCSGEHMPTKFSPQLVPSNIPLRRWNIPAVPTQARLLHRLQSFSRLYTQRRPRPLPCSYKSSHAGRTQAPCTLAQAQGLPLCSVSSGGRRGNGNWREGGQGWPGGGAAAGPGRGHAAAPRRALRRAVSVRVSLLVGPCYVVSIFFSWCGFCQGWFLCALLAGSMRLSPDPGNGEGFHSDWALSRCPSKLSLVCRKSLDLSWELGFVKSG